MNFAVRTFIGYFLLLAIVAGVSIYQILDQIHRPMSQSKELILVDVANLLAELAQPYMKNNALAEGPFATQVDRYLARRQNASIFGNDKHRAELRVYVTNVAGVVIYDSADQDVGKDFSQWRDVYLTLHGKYGARSTQQADVIHTTMYVGAPIFDEHKIMGVLTVSAPNENLDPFVQWAKQRILESTLLIGLLAVIIGLLLAAWTGRGVRQLAQYAQETSQGKIVPLPGVQGRELRHLAQAIDDMRKKIDGKAYVENYVQLLTHELKSPLSGIHGAAELLQEPLPQEVQTQLVDNIQSDSLRIQKIIDNLLSLAKLEHQQTLQASSIINLSELVHSVVATKTPIKKSKNISMTEWVEAEVIFVGDRFLVEQALGNLIDNALDFTPVGGGIRIRLFKPEPDIGEIQIYNEGPSIPDFAMPRLFERFYSLPRPDTQKKGTGLGLVLVKEVAELHGGNVSLMNVPGGVEARLRLHINSTQTS